MALVSIKKATFLGSLYLTQTVPKGYLKFLPVLMAERGESMLLISAVALFSVGDWLKPLFGAFIDMNKVSSPRSRKRIILLIQCAMIATFILAMYFEKPQLIQLAALFSFCSLLTSVHDTAVDGLAVQILGEDEQAIGGFGQYAGYKLGSLITGGILPALVGTNHRLLCIGVVVPMLIVLLFTSQYDVSSHAPAPAATKETKGTQQREATTRTNPASKTSINPLDPPTLGKMSLVQSYIRSIPHLTEVLMLFAYKFADHGLDFIWSPMLVHANIKRKTIVQTQFMLGTGAAIVGACYGSYVCKLVGNAPKALAYCSILRIIPNVMQLWFAYARPVEHAIPFVAAHAVLENIAGSAVTGAMFAVLLQKSDPAQPATSYAVMNTIALMGMTVGEFCLAQWSHFYGFRSACMVGVLINVMYPLVSLLLLKEEGKLE